MFPINPLRIKQRIMNLFDKDKKIKEKLKLKTEKIERECEMYSMITSKKHKIQYRFTVTGIEREDGIMQFGCGDKNDVYVIDDIKHSDEPVMKAIRIVEDEIRKNLKIPERKKP